VGNHKTGIVEQGIQYAISVVNLAITKGTAQWELLRDKNYKEADFSKGNQLKHKYTYLPGGGGDIENEEFTDMMTSTTIVG
jgi:hypothetical protein